MAITIRPLVTFSSGNINQASPRTTSTLTIAAGDVITVAAAFSDGATPGTVSISNSGTALTWNSIATVTSTGVRMYAWYAIAGQTENRTVSIAWNSGSNKQVNIFAMVHTGAHQTTPIPVGNVLSGVDASSLSLPITPTAAGSALWLVTGDWSTTGTSSVTAGTNCTVESTLAVDTFDAVLIRPTTQPRTDGAAFTLAETHTGANVNYIAFEVQAAGAAQSQAPRSLHQYSMRHAA